MKKELHEFTDDEVITEFYRRMAAAADRIMHPEKYPTQLELPLEGKEEER